MKQLQRPKEARIPFTQEGYTKLLIEKKQLMSLRPEAVDHLRKSREMGDLSENGYYKAARARLSFLDAQIRRVDRLIRLGVVIQSAKSGVVEIGSTVIINDGKKELTYTIAGGYESNPAQGTISYISPIGKALLGKKIGDTVEVRIPAGVVRYTVKNVQ